jgi:protein-tyrosine phosphatase
MQDRRQSWVMSINSTGERQYTAQQSHKQSSAGKNTVGRTFRNGCCVTLRFIYIIVVVVISSLTLVTPLLYIMCGGNIGLLLQPLILANKARKGKPRFNEITCKANYKLFLGAQPDLYGGFHPLFGKQNIRTVVSLNSEKERAGNLWMAPPAEKHYLRHGVNFVKVTLNDHSPLTVPMLATSAEAIHEGLAVGDVYVHCKAGQGRSAQAILAYLMKYDHEAPDDAIAHMQRDRPNITLKTTQQVAQLKPKKRQKNEERHQFFLTFLNQQCSPPELVAGIPEGTKNPLNTESNSENKMVTMKKAGLKSENSIRTATGFVKRYEVAI